MNITIDLNDQSLTQLGLAAKTAFFRAISNAEAHCPGIVAVSTDVDDHELNLVIDTQINENEIDEKITQIIQFFAKHPYDWAWIIGPLTKPTHLIDELHNHAFALTEEYPGMYFDLMTELPDCDITDFAIEEVSHADQLTEWIKPVAKAFEFDNPIDAEAYRVAHAKILHGAGTAFHHFIGFYQQQPVSAITLFIYQNTVVIRNLTTDPQFSKRGFGTALMTYAMNTAKKLGCQHCFLDASPDGVWVYRKMGFKIYGIYSSYSLN